MRGWNDCWTLGYLDKVLMIWGKIFTFEVKLLLTFAYNLFSSVNLLNIDSHKCTIKTFSSFPFFPSNIKRSARAKKTSLSTQNDSTSVGYTFIHKQTKTWYLSFPPKFIVWTFFLHQKRDLINRNKLE